MRVLINGRNMVWPVVPTAATGDRAGRPSRFIMCMDKIHTAVGMRTAVATYCAHMLPASSDAAFK